MERPDVFQKIEGGSSADALYRKRLHLSGAVHVEGGAKRGTGEPGPMVDHHHCRTNPLADILKALCLGATAVGIGRPFLYAQSVGFALDPSSHVL